jgi:transposase-like protein
MAMTGMVRRLHYRQQKSVRGIARLTSLSRNTVRKWRKAPVAPRVRIVVAPIESSNPRAMLRMRSDREVSCPSLRFE